MSAFNLGVKTAWPLGLTPRTSGRRWTALLAGKTHIKPGGLSRLHRACAATAGNQMHLLQSYTYSRCGVIIIAKNCKQFRCAVRCLNKL